MILSDRDILQEIRDDNIVCYPFEKANLSNSSIDLRLGQYILEEPKVRETVKFSTDRNGRLTVLNKVEPIKYDLLKQVCILEPGAFVLAHTLELVGQKSDSIISQIADKSTLARLGLSTHFSAGYIDAGNVLNITLELKNQGNNPIQLQYGMHICQIVFHRLSSPVLEKYSGKYLYPTEVQTAK